MRDNDAVINPERAKNSPELGPVAVITATEPDLSTLCSLLNLNPDTYRKLFISRLYIDEEAHSNISLIGPLIGAPYATMLLETIIAWGARKIIFLGWCGAILNKVKIGDIILPTSAFIDEGTSRHYNADMAASVPSEEIVRQTRQRLQEDELDFHQGVIWSTDAVYRETREKVEYFQRKDVLAVDMETSALFTVSQFREVEVGAILVVSDELSTGQWRPGFKDNHFKQARMGACRLVKELCQTL